MRILQIAIVAIGVLAAPVFLLGCRPSTTPTHTPDPTRSTFVAWINHVNSTLGDLRETADEGGWSYGINKGWLCEKPGYPSQRTFAGVKCSGEITHDFGITILYFSRWDSPPAAGQIPEWIDDVRVEVVEIRPTKPM